MAAVAAEHGLHDPFVGVAYDGLGLGADGTLWGGEILVADLSGYHRVGRFATAPLPAATRRYAIPPAPRPRPSPGRRATGHPASLPLADKAVHGPSRPGGGERRTRDGGRGLQLPTRIQRRTAVRRRPALLGLADNVTYEGEAAVRLGAAAGATHAVPQAHRIVRTDGLWVFDSTPTLTDLLARRLGGEPVPSLAAAFHLTLAFTIADLVARAVEEGAPHTVRLGGGC